MKLGKYLISSFLLAIFLAAAPSLVVAAEKAFVVALDAGHGGKDPGAVGKWLKLKESEVNLSVALKLGAMLEKHPDIKVLYSRKKNVKPEFVERTNTANKANADVFISIHCNANTDRSVKGTQSFVLGLEQADENMEVVKAENAALLYEENPEELAKSFKDLSPEQQIALELRQSKNLEQSIKIATYIENEFTKGTPMHSKGLAQQDLFVLRINAMPSVLVEMGFISNRDEEKYLSDEENHKTLAACMYKAILKVKAEKEKKQGQVPVPEPEPEPAPPTPPATPASKPAPPAAKPDTAAKPSAPKEPVQTTPTPTSTPSAVPAGTVVYKVQVMASEAEIPLSDSRLKKYKNVSFYKEKGLYKYTIGESTLPEEIGKIRQQLLPDFKDAFIVRFVDGVRQY